MKIIYHISDSDRIEGMVVKKETPQMYKIDEEQTNLIFRHHFLGLLTHRFSSIRKSD